VDFAMRHRVDPLPRFVDEQSEMIIGAFRFRDQFRVSGSNIFNHLDPRGSGS
jgi:hypothetical protein